MVQINIHTHHHIKDGNLQVVNLFSQNLSDINPDYLFSTGIHPWHIQKVNLNDCYRNLERSIGIKNMIAVGECGLDRSIELDFALQEKCFKVQIEIANEHAKPLIIHCVRSYSDLIRIKKETKSEVPWIVHGYMASHQTTKQLISHGFFFSVGEKLLNAISKHEIFRSIPIDRLFLETDNHQISISQIYDQASSILKIDNEILSEYILRNFNTIFGTHKIEK